MHVIPVTNAKGFKCTQCGHTKVNMILEQGKAKIECQKCSEQTMINFKKCGQSFLS